MALASSKSDFFTVAGEGKFSGSDYNLFNCQFIDLIFCVEVNQVLWKQKKFLAGCQQKNVFSWTPVKPKNEKCKNNAFSVYFLLY